MNLIYNEYLNDIRNENRKSIIYRIFLDEQAEEYLKETSNERMVIDFIAGMTDDLFLQEVERVMR